MSQAIIVMGVSGSGKTTIGKLLAEALGWPFYDADDFHPPANVERMRQGIALTDEDRKPWLAALARLIAEALATNQSIVLASSALKEAYREQLKPRGVKPADEPFVYLRVPPEVAAARLKERHGHFMPASLVPSQFAALEEPADAIVIDATQSPDEIVAQIRQELAL
jgi:carbohydrate kinase, thermoresistant glucokinase family